MFNPNGEITRLTRENFDTEADFLKWKQWSDENYHLEERADHVHSNHSLSLDFLLNKAPTSEALEILLEQQKDRSDREKHSTETVLLIKVHLTETQFRRLWMYCVDGMTEREIAMLESVNQRRISESITTALKKIFKVLSFRHNSES